MVFWDRSGSGKIYYTLKNTKHQRLTSSFEEIQMEENETSIEFCVKIKDIVNSSYNLGERILEPKIVRKILQSFQERFHTKTTAIEESKDRHNSTNRTCRDSPNLLDGLG